MAKILMLYFPRKKKIKKVKIADSDGLMDRLLNGPAGVEDKCDLRGQILC